MTIIPKYLQPRSRIAITCPAGYLEAAKAENCIRILEDQGYEVVTGKTVISDSANYFSADDDARLTELQRFLDDGSIDAVLCGRGGYGTTRIIDRLDFTAFAKKPKWIIGFSDITVLHAHLLSNYNIASLHAPMAAAFKDGLNDFNETLLKSLRGEIPTYRSAAHDQDRFGRATGNLVGGNLSMLAHLCGTPSDIDSTNCILFLEDISEYSYHIDRMLYQLKRSGKFDRLKGMIFGGFTDIKDTQRPFGRTINEILAEAVSAYDFPVCFNFPVSHGAENVALKIGATYELTVQSDGATLRELSRSR